MIDYCYNLHFLSYMIFDQQLKITFRKSSDPPVKIHSTLFTQSPHKKSKSASPPFLPTIKVFQVPHAERGRALRWMCIAT